MWLDRVWIFILIFSIWSNLSAIWSVLESLVRLILDNKPSMTSVRAVSQQSFPSISAQRRADIPFCAALTFWLVPHEVHLRTFEPTACGIFLLQDFIGHVMKTFTLSTTLNSWIIGTCRGIGYGFWGSRSLNRVSCLTLLLLCPWCGP